MIGDELRHAIGHFATGATGVTSLDEHGPVGTTASAVSDATQEPLLHCRGGYARLGAALPV